MTDIKNNMPIPEKLEVIPAVEGVIIRKRWFSLKYIPMAIFAIVWDAFLFFWYTMAITGDNVPWIMIVFPLGHVAVGFGITYTALCGFVNRTDLHVRHNLIEIRTTPLPWLGNKTVPLDAINSVNVRERAGQNGCSYNVMYISHDNREKKLLTGFEFKEQAEYIKMLVDNVLTIKRTAH